MGPEKQLTRAQIKRRNRSNIYRMVLDGHGVSRQDIARALELSLPTVQNNLTDLIEEGLVQKTGFLGDTGGRKAYTYGIVPDARTAIGFDITRHHITAVAVDLKGEIMGRIRIRHDFEMSDLYMRRLGEIVKELLEESGIKRESVLGVGIGIPGLTTEDNQEIFYGRILDFEGADCADFSKYIPFRTALFNDAKAAAFAEFHSHPEMKSAFYIMLSNNVGGAVIIDGQVWRGGNLCAAEIGHLTLDPLGPVCYCGQRGCMDIYCAATVLDSQYGDNLENFFVHLKGKEKKAVSLWNTYLDYLARAINTVRLLFDCPIILGGYVGAYMNEYIEELRRRVEELDSFHNPPSEVRCCEYRREAIAAGAALHFITEYIDTV